MSITPVEAVVTDGATNDTSLVVDLPTTVDAGDGLLLFIATDGDTADTPMAASGSWVGLGQAVTGGGGGQVSGGAWYLDAVGDEDGGTVTIDWTGGPNEVAHAIVVRYPAADVDFGSIPPQVAGTPYASGASATYQSPALSGLSSNDYSYLVAAMVDRREFSANPDGHPSGYTELGRSGAPSGPADVSVIVSHKDTNATTGDTPGTGGIATSDEWVAITVAVAPKPAAVTDVDGSGNVASSSTATATRGRPVAGSAPSASRAPATAVRTRAIVGSAPAASSMSGAFAAIISEVDGAASTAASASATLEVVRGISGSASVAGHSTSTAARSRGLAGSASAAESTTGSTTRVRTFVASAPAAVTVSGVFETIVVALDGFASAACLSSGDLDATWIGVFSPPLPTDSMSWTGYSNITDMGTGAMQAYNEQSSRDLMVHGGTNYGSQDWDDAWTELTEPPWDRYSGTIPTGGARACWAIFGFLEAGGSTRTSQDETDIEAILDEFVTRDTDETLEVVFWSPMIQYDNVGSPTAGPARSIECQEYALTFDHQYPFRIIAGPTLGPLTSDLLDPDNRHMNEDGADFIGAQMVAWFDPFGDATQTLDGVGNSASSATAALTVTTPVAAVATVAVSASTLLTATVPVVGVGTVAVTALVAVGLTKELNGIGANASSTAGALDSGGALDLDGSASNASSVGVTISIGREVEAAASTAAFATASPIRLRAVDSAASSATTSAGTLDTAKGLAAVGSSASSATASLDTAGSLTLDGTANNAASASATVTVARIVSGVASAASTAPVAVSRLIGVAGVGQAASEPSGALVGARGISGVAVAASSATGEVQFLLYGSAASVSSSLLALDVARHLTAISSVAIATTSIIDRTRGMGAVGSAVGDGRGVISILDTNTVVDFYRSPRRFQEGVSATERTLVPTARGYAAPVRVSE